jgi:hypothetical protein
VASQVHDLSRLMVLRAEDVLPDKVDDTKRWLPSAAAVFTCFCWAVSGSYEAPISNRIGLLLQSGMNWNLRDVNPAVVSCAALPLPFRRVPIR